MDPIIVIFGFGIGLLIGMTGMGGGSPDDPSSDPAVRDPAGDRRRHRHLLRRRHQDRRRMASPEAPHGPPGDRVLARGRQRPDGDRRSVADRVPSEPVRRGFRESGRARGRGGGATRRGDRDADPGPVPARRDSGALRVAPLYRRHIIAAVITGATTGFVIGLTSAGSGTLIAIVLIAVFRLTPQRVVGTDVVHAAILLWAGGAAHWVGGNVDLGLAANILVGSIPGVLIGSQLAVRIPTGFLRNALGVVMIASAVVLITKEKVPPAVLIPSLSVAALVIVGLFAFQIGLHRQRMRQD